VYFILLLLLPQISFYASISIILNEEEEEGREGGIGSDKQF